MLYEVITFVISLITILGYLPWLAAMLWQVNNVITSYSIHYTKLYEYVVEDAAQGIMSTYKGKPLGTFGEFGSFSFHETKNYSMGEGGALLIRDAKYIEPAEIIREKGTDRSKFFRGQVDKYTWVNFRNNFV